MSRQIALTWQRRLLSFNRRIPGLVIQPITRPVGLFIVQRRLISGQDRLQQMLRSVTSDTARQIIRRTAIPIAGTMLVMLILPPAFMFVILGGLGYAFYRFAKGIMSPRTPFMTSSLQSPPSIFRDLASMDFSNSAAETLREMAISKFENSLKKEEWNLMNALAIPYDHPDSNFNVSFSDVISSSRSTLGMFIFPGGGGSSSELSIEFVATISDVGQVLIIAIGKEHRDGVQLKRIEILVSKTGKRVILDANGSSGKSTSSSDKVIEGEFREL